MKFLVLSFSFITILFSSQTILKQKAFEVHSSFLDKGVALLNFPNALHLFFYERYKAQPYHKSDSFSFIAQSQTKPTHTLSQYHIDAKGTIHKRTLDFFKQSHNLLATQNQNRAFLAALTSQNHLKVAKLNAQGHIKWKRALNKSMKQIFLLYHDHKDRLHIFYLRDNRPHKNGYFNRGIATQSYGQLTLNAQGMPIKDTLFNPETLNEDPKSLLFDQKLYILSHREQNNTLFTHTLDFNQNHEEALNVTQPIDALFVYKNQLGFSSKNRFYLTKQNNRVFINFDTRFQSIEALMALSKSKNLLVASDRQHNHILACSDTNGTTLWSKLFKSDERQKNLALRYHQGYIYWLIAQTHAQNEGRLFLFKLNEKGQTQSIQAPHQTQKFFHAWQQKLPKMLRSKIVLEGDAITLKYFYRIGAFKLSKQETQELKQILKAMLDTLLNPKFKNRLTALYLNGHSSREWKNSSIHQAYLNNADLGFKRAFHALELLIQLSSNQPKYSFFKAFLSTNSLSSAHPVTDPYGHENKKQSRRITINLRWKP